MTSTHTNADLYDDISNGTKDGHSNGADSNYSNGTAAASASTFAYAVNHALHVCCT